MKGYTIVAHEVIEANVKFIRIEPTDIALTLKEVFESLADLAWISSFDRDYIRHSFLTRAKPTIDYISNRIIRSADNAITSNSGEYVISELARKTIVEEMKYLDIPLAELIKDKTVGNHGFDFYTKSQIPIILFGEAKYNSTQNAYGSSFKQIIRFVNESQDSSDLLDIEKFCCKPSMDNFSKGRKGFIAAFAAKGISTETLIKNIKENEDYKKLVKFEELVCVGVNI